MAQNLKQRRLNPIYEACDSNNYKLAIQLADKILKKDPGLDTAIALRALALNRLGNKEEAIERVQYLSTQTTLDENCINVLSICAREVGQPELLVAVYEKAVKKNPYHEEFAQSLFYSYTRVNKYKEMQQLAMNCYKQFKTDVYYFWAVMCMLLQAKEQIKQGNAAMAKMMLLPLAEKMMGKAMKDKKFTSEEHLNLYLQILGAQENHSAAAEVAESEAGLKCLKDEVERLQIYAQLNEKANNYDKVLALRKQLLEKNADEWGSWKGYITAVVALDAEHALEEGERASSQLQRDLSRTSSNLSGKGTPPASPRTARHAKLHIDSRMLFNNLRKKTRESMSPSRSPTRALRQKSASRLTINKANVSVDAVPVKRTGSATSLGMENGVEEGSCTSLGSTCSTIRTPVMDALEFINDKIADEGSKPLRRGPFLAKMELLNRLFQDGKRLDQPKCQQTLRECLIDYFHKFGDKWCCLSDMASYLSFVPKGAQDEVYLEYVAIQDKLRANNPIQLSEDAPPAVFGPVGSLSDLADVKLNAKDMADLKEQVATGKGAGRFIKSLMEDGMDPPTSDITDWKLLSRYTCCLQLKHRLGLHDNLIPSQRVALVDKLCHTYVNTIHLGKDLLPTERQYSDDLILLAADELVDMYARYTDEQLAAEIDTSDSSMYLELAAVLIAYAQKASPTNFYLKAKLVPILRYLGAAEPAHKAYKSMDIKYVMHDTLSYLVQPALLSCANYKLARSTNQDTVTIYRHNTVEVPEMVVKAFKHSTFSKIEEFIRFRARLDSLLKRQVATDDVWVAFMSAGSSALALEALREAPTLVSDKATIEALADNRDFTVLQSPTNNPDTTISTLTEAHETNTRVHLRLHARVSALQLKLAHALLVDTDASTSTSTSTGTGTDTQGRDQAQTIKEELKTCLEEIRNLPSPHSAVGPVVGPSVSPVLSCEAALKCLVAFAHPSLHLSTIRVSAATDTELPEAFAQASDLYREAYLQSGLNTADTIVPTEAFFTKLHHFTALTLVVCLYLEKLLTPFNNRKVKKGLLPPLPDWVLNSVRPLAEDVSRCMKASQKVIDTQIEAQKQRQADTNILPEHMRSLSDVIATQKEVTDSLSKSRIASLSVFKSVFNSRSQLLKLRI